MENKEKIRVSLFLDKDLVDTADQVLKERGYRSRNEFYTALLGRVVSEELTEKHKDILGEKFAAAMEQHEADIKRAIAKGLFRYAVYLEVIAKILADRYEYSETEVSALMREAVKNVRRLRGKIPLEKILAGYYVEHQIEATSPLEWEIEKIF